MPGKPHNAAAGALSMETGEDPAVVPEGGAMAARKSGSNSRRRRLSPSTRAGEYVREEIHHAREGKHPVKSRKQAIAIGLSKARRKGVKVPAKKRS